MTTTLSTETFSLAIEDGENVCNIIGNIIFLDKSCIVWIGEAESAPTMENLIMSMPTRFETYPLSSMLLGNDVENDANATGISQRLSKKFSIQTFVSCSVPLNHDGMKKIENLLIELLQKRQNTVI
jgi:hypothetical protein